MKRSVLMAGLVGCGASAAAPRAPALSPDLAMLQFYVGHWDCDGVELQPAEKRWKATVDVVPVLGGKWLSVVMRGPDGNETAEFKGYDPDRKQWLHVYTSNDGGWGVVAAPAFDGTTMVYKSLTDPSDTSVTTFTKLAENRYSHGVADAEGHEIWKKTCSKRS